MDVSKFGTDDMPLRPSSLGKMAKCPMQVVLSYFDRDDGGAAAQTGNVVHGVAEKFHGGTSREEALAAIDPLMRTFPEARREDAWAYATAYLDDPKNRDAVVPWREQRVTCRVRATGEVPLTRDPPPLPDDVVIAGTLDQIRRMADGTLLVWDLKTGTAHTPEECVAEYQRQQAAYVVGAIQTLDPAVRPGGLIYTAGYSKGPRARTHLPMKVELHHCVEQLLDVLVDVLGVRRGHRSFRPSAGACGYCPFKQYPKCSTRADGLLGVSK